MTLQVRNFLFFILSNSDCFLIFNFTSVGTDINLLMNASDPHTHSRNAYKTLADMQIGVLEGHENDKGIDDEYKEPIDWDKSMLDQVRIEIDSRGK